MPAYYFWKLEVRVPNTVVARGGTVDREELQAHIAEELGAYDDEHVSVMLVKQPDDKAIQREQS